MKRHCPDNERIKRKYYEWLKEAKQRSQSTVDNVRKAISRFEQYTHYKDFKTFNKDQAVAFKHQLLNSKSLMREEPLSKGTLLTTIRHLEDFFRWLTYQPGYKKVKLWHIDYLNLSEKDTRIALSRSLIRIPTIEQIKRVIESMPSKTEIELRNRALIAFTLLTGIRDSAIASLRLKHINLIEELVEQPGSEVKTKFSKTIHTFFFPVGEEIKQIFVDWVNYLYKEKLFNGDSPVFPRTRLVLNKDKCFMADGIEPKFWQSASQIRKIFKEAFQKAGIDYFPPHTFRKTLTRLGYDMCKTPEESKAWSQNFGHENPSTMFTSYGYIEPYRQGQVIKNIFDKGNQDDAQLVKMLEVAAFKLKHKSKESR